MPQTLYTRLFPVPGYHKQSHTRSFHIKEPLHIPGIRETPCGFSDIGGKGQANKASKKREEGEKDAPQKGIEIATAEGVEPSCLYL